MTRYVIDASAIAIVPNVRDGSEMIFSDILNNLLQNIWQHFSVFLAGGISAGPISLGFLKVREHYWLAKDRAKRNPSVEANFKQGTYFTDETGGWASVLISFSNSGEKATTLKDFDLNFPEKIRIDKQYVSAVWNATCDQVIKGQKQVCVRGGESVGATLYFKLPNTSFTLCEKTITGTLSLCFVDHHPITVPMKLVRSEPCLPKAPRRKSSFFDRPFVTNW